MCFFKKYFFYKKHDFHASFWVLVLARKCWKTWICRQIWKAPAKLNNGKRFWKGFKNGNLQKIVKINIFRKTKFHWIKSVFVFFLRWECVHCNGGLHFIFEKLYFRLKIQFVVEFRNKNANHASSVILKILMMILWN